jgi:hypothetical protein
MSANAGNVALGFAWVVGSNAAFRKGSVPLAYYTLVDKGFKTVQVLRSQSYGL